MITKILRFSFARFLLLAGVCLAADKPITDDAIVDQVRLKLVGGSRRERRRHRPSIARMAW